jgi:hypothetical protein
MTDALLFFRTIGTNKFLTPDPDNLPSDQKLIFTLPGELLESVALTYENNIKDAPVSNPAGVRKVNTQDNGLQKLELTFRGRFKDESTDIEKVLDFAQSLQVEGVFHQFGVFGFQASANELPSSAVSTPFNFDPTQFFGLTIKRLNIKRVGNAPKTFDFDMVLSFGGTIEGTEVTP